MKKTKSTPFLDFYYKWMESTDKLGDGLCLTLDIDVLDTETWKMIKPTDLELVPHRAKGVLSHLLG